MIRSVIILFILFATPTLAFVPGMTLEQKCAKSDVIVRGVVVRMVHLSMKVNDSQGHDFDNALGEEYGGPYSVALVRVTEVLKGNKKMIRPVILVPCGYNIDESPAELTDSKDYVLFLESMGANYFHPVGHDAMHRVRLDQVGKSGLDWDGDFDQKMDPNGTISYAEFSAQIRKLINTPKADD